MPCDVADVIHALRVHDEHGLLHQRSSPAMSSGMAGSLRATSAQRGRARRDAVTTGWQDATASCATCLASSPSLLMGVAASRTDEKRCPTTAWAGCPADQRCLCGVMHHACDAA